MTAQPAEVVHVLGRAPAGDAVTATARALRTRLARLGRPGRVVSADPFDAAPDAHLVVHCVDGGEALAPLVGDLVGRAVTLVHHGSVVGSDRATLRALRGSTRCAVAADPAAREALRALGFGTVGILDSSVADDAFADVDADPVTAEGLTRHPGPLLLCVGPVAPNRGLEALISGFADLLTHTKPAAVLSLCGPSSSWYQTRLGRHVTSRGLLACEVVEPAHEGEVRARLDRADVVIALRPTSLDPYLRHATRQGLPIVAPLVEATAHLDPQALVAISTRPSPAELAAALADALERPRRAVTGLAPADRAADSALLRVLGLA